MLNWVFGLGFFLVILLIEGILDWGLEFNLGFFNLMGGGDVNLFKYLMFSLEIIWVVFIGWKCFIFFRLSVGLFFFLVEL